MKLNAILLVTALMSFLSGPAAADEPVVVACFRGPWKSVIWDRPEDVFIESLMANRFSYSRAVEIGERACRDAYLVNKPELLVQRVEELIAATPQT